MAGLHMALLVLVGSASAIEPWTLGDLGGSLVGPSKVYDDLDTDVSIARRPEHSARSSAPKKEPVLPHWEEADLTRRYEEQQKMNAHRCRNFMGREVPCSGPPSIVHPGQIHPGLLPSETVELGSNQKKMCETPFHCTPWSNPPRPSSFRDSGAWFKPEENVRDPGLHWCFSHALGQHGPECEPL